MKGNLTLALRCPLYLAITDLFAHAFALGNFLVPIVTGHLVSDPFCRLLGAGLSFFAGANMMVTALITVLAFFSVCKDKKIDIGKYDWKLIVTIVFTMVIIIAVSFPSFGPDGIWCFCSIEGENPILLYFATYFPSAMFLALCLFSIYIMVYLRRNENELIEKKDHIMNFQKVRKEYKMLQVRMLRKQMVYVLFYVIQWGPVLPYMIRRTTSFIPEESLFVVLTLSISMNLGGVLNLIGLVINE
jgi:hypothetical protein